MYNLHKKHIMKTIFLMEIFMPSVQRNIVIFAAVLSKLKNKVYRYRYYTTRITLNQRRTPTMKTKQLKKYPIPVLMMAITFGLTLLLPYLSGYLIDNVLASYDEQKLWGWFGVTFLVAVVSMSFSFFFCNYNLNKYVIINNQKLQQKAVNDILHMNPSLFSKKDKGYYYNLCANSSMCYAEVHEEVYCNLIGNLLYIIALLAVITYTNWVFGIFFLIYGFLLGLFSLYGSKPLFDIQSTVLTKQDTFLSENRNIIENKLGINALHTEAFFQKEFDKCCGNFTKYLLKYKFWYYMCVYAPVVINKIFSIVYLFIAAFLVFRGQITVGVLMMGYQYLECFADPITLVCNILTRYKSNKVHVDRVDQLSEDAAKECEIEQHKADQDALFQTESFDFYKGEAPENFLYHIGQLTLKKNGLYVIKGENGSGKSMLMNLMLGNISSEYSKGNFSVSQKINDTAFLTYPFFAIDGSFDDNLFGIARNEELLALLNVDFADKEITSNPVNLSYGQQQKLALMRLFGTDEPTLFLDEPLSNLDAETQHHLIQYIKSLKGKKTILVIMHSDELDDFADGILWIHDHQMILGDRTLA